MGGGEGSVVGWNDGSRIGTIDGANDEPNGGLKTVKLGDIVGLHVGVPILGAADGITDG